MCWNIVIFSGLTIDKKIRPLLRLFGHKLSCVWPQSNKAS